MPDAAAPRPALPAPLAAVLGADAPRASAFIVTIYGDVAEPRGGTLGMGTLIECCTDHGLSESLVRTAVSRLVAAGRLIGERQGRKSYYRLTEAAQREFAGAAGVLYAPPPAPTGWLIAMGEGTAAAASELAGWARAGQAVAIAPARSDVDWPAGLVFSAEAVEGIAELPSTVSGYWPLGEVAEDFQRFVESYAPVAEELAGGFAPGEATALALRLRLVHDFRQAALADPRLPVNALPADWPGDRARALFVRIYLALAAAADRRIGQCFHDTEGRLPRETTSSRLRIDRLRREAGRLPQVET